MMDDTFIHSTADEHMDDLLDLFTGTTKVWFKDITIQMSIH